jgi:hypothetical protein
MEPTACVDTVIHKRFFFLEFLHELSDELYLLVLLAKNTFLLGFVFSDEFCIFFYNIYFDNPSNHIE